MGLGQTLIPTTQEVYGISFLGQALGKMGHAPVTPDDGEAMGGVYCMGIVGHKRSLLSGAL
jgi:hypothetical protein